MSARRLLVAVVVSVALLSAASPALADGIIIPDPPCIVPCPPPWPPVPEPDWLTIRYHRVTVTIADQVATTHVDQLFVNEHNWEVEGTYIFPVPEGAVVSDFTMWVDGERMTAEVLDAEQARAIYEEIVRNRRDPALLEYVGRDALRLRIFPIPPGGERRVELEYTQVLPMEEGRVRYVYPLDTERFSDRPIEEVSIRVEIESPDPIRTLYSPTHQSDLYIERDGEYRATVGYEETDVLPDQDFELDYTVSAEEVGLSLLTYREPPDDGFFLLLAAPSVEVDPDRVVPRDIFLVFDVSGSMDGEKIEQARQAAIYILRHLNEGDRFNIIAFSSGLRLYANSLRPSAEAEEAVAWVRRLEASGGTDINRALLEALSQADVGRNTVLIFLTDGQPTEGETDIADILDNSAGAAPDGVRLFPFGVGDDVNTALLDGLAEQHHGSTGYVRPGEAIDEEVSAFYARISAPVLTDLDFDFGSVTAEEIYPDPLPDLFAGTQLIVAGRYRGDGPARIVLSGQVNGERREYIYEGTFRASGGDDFIPRLWAARKIGYLLTQIRLHGEREEWVEAVVDLSTRYGIITPYTSFLIEENLLTAGGQEEAVERFLAQPVPPAAGAPAVEMADAEAGLRGSESVSDETLPEGAAQVIRHVGSRTFVLRDGVWTDTAFDPERMTTQRVTFASPNYFDLLAARPEWGAYLALGERVIFIAEGTAYEVVTEEVEPVPVPATHVPGGTTGSTPAPTPPTSPASPPPDGSLCFGASLSLLIGVAIAAVWQRKQR